MNVLKATENGSSPLLDAVEYAWLAPGKRIRPILVLESAGICGGDDAVAMNAALAVECVHAFSLIHDDLPAMDDDEYRRGRLTCHKKFGEAMAILAGDWLAAHAFEVLAANPTPPGSVSAVVSVLAAATQAMTVGQAADIVGEGQPPDKALVETIHRNKTAALLEACTTIGARVAGASEPDIERMAEYGRRLGLAFQIADDLLDRGGSSAALGKQAGKDDRRGKQTYPAAYGEAVSRTRANEEIAAAIQTLEPFGPRAENLRKLAHFVIARDR